MNLRILLLALIGLAIFNPVNVLSSSGGVGGGGYMRTTVSGGCGGSGGCHSMTASTNTTVTWKDIVGHEITLKPGETKTIEITVENTVQKNTSGGDPAAGINIGLLKGLNGSMVRSMLSTTDARLQAVLGQELTHRSPQQMTGGTITYSFVLKAPAAEGTYSLQAIANVVNGDGSAGVQDQWNWATPLVVNVQNTSSVEDDLNAAIRVFPQPASDHVSIALPADDASSYRVDVQDLTGSIVYSTTIMSDGEGAMFKWDGRSSTSASTSSGIYNVVFTSERRVFRRRVTFLH